MRRGLTDNLRFLLALGGVAVGAALFAIAFRLSLGWLYRSVYHADNVVDVMEAVALGHVQLSMRSTASRVASSWAAIAGGMSIGREGPLIEFGGALGAAVGPR